MFRKKIPAGLLQGSETRRLHNEIINDFDTLKNNTYSIRSYDKVVPRGMYTYSRNVSSTTVRW